MAGNLQFAGNKKALVIVAHPDDETIWLGGFILRHQQLSWTIFSLCRASDADRAPKFKRVCKLYKARAIITDLEDEDKLTIKQTLPVIKKLILQKIKNKKFNYLFTHGTNGEYGHPRHLGVHRAVRQLIKERKLKIETIFYFNYVKARGKIFAPPQVKRDPDLLLKLTKAEFNKKKGLMTDVYGFAADGIDVGYCTNPEALKMQSKV